MSAKPGHSPTQRVPRHGYDAVCWASGEHRSKAEFMFGKKRQNAQPVSDEFSASFAPLRALTLDRVPALEFFMLGAVANEVGQLRGRSVFGEKNATDLFSSIQIAAALAGGERGRQIVWPDADARTIEYRRLAHSHFRQVADRPTTLLTMLVPAIQDQLGRHAGDANAQTAWVWTWIMFGLVSGTQNDGVDYKWALPVLYGNALKWPSIANSRRPQP